MILPVYSGSKSIGKRFKIQGSRFKAQGSRGKDKGREIRN
jgi:hypothetical protein